MVLGHHLIISAYGFWLPNDPRGSWSDFVRAWELTKFGDATKVTTHRSVAGVPHDRQLRMAAKEALKARQAEQETLSESALVALTMIRTFSPPVQPVQAPEPASVNTAYKYKVGDAVYFTSPSFGRAAASGAYTVIKVLPSDGEDRQYRIKSSVEAFERVAKESQLERI